MPLDIIPWDPGRRMTIPAFRCLSCLTTIPTYVPRVRLDACYFVDCVPSIPGVRSQCVTMNSSYSDSQKQDSTLVFYMTDSLRFRKPITLTAGAAPFSGPYDTTPKPGDRFTKSGRHPGTAKVSRDFGTSPERCFSLRQGGYRTCFLGTAKYLYVFNSYTTWNCRAHRQLQLC